MECSRRSPPSAVIQPVFQPHLRQTHNHLVAGSSPTSSTTQCHGRRAFPESAEQPRNWPDFAGPVGLYYRPRRRLTLFSPPLSLLAKSVSRKSETSVAETRFVRISIEAIHEKIGKAASAQPSLKAACGRFGFSRVMMPAGAGCEIGKTVLGTRPRAFSGSRH